MPTTYTPDPTATQAPASQPDPDDFPLESLPNSGEGATAASITQAFKVVGDYIAWLKSPRAKASSWAQTIRHYKNALLQTRFLIDHPGFPAGKILQWNETWDDVGFLTSKESLGNGPWVGRWRYSITGDPAGGAIYGGQAAEPLPNFPFGSPASPSNLRTPNVVLATSPAGTALSIQEIESAANVVIDDDTCFTMQWDATILSSSAGSPADDNFMGVIVGSLLAATGTFGSNLLPAIGFQIGSGQTTYRVAYKGTGAGGYTVLDTTIAKSADRDRFRMEYYGPNVSDTGSAKILFYINGAPVAGSPIALTLTGAAPLGPATARCCFRHADAAILTWMNVQTTDFRANIWPGDVAF